MKSKRYPKEFKDQVIKDALEINDVGQVAKRYEVHPKTLYRWISESKHKAWQQTSSESKKTAVYIPSHKEYKQLEKENDKLKNILGEKDLEIAILRDLLKKKNPGFQTE
ncbi:transposase [Desulforamulus aquiferis]|uniref:Transposase n=1 Tax=Desulforamulus aquiferis TaxID=1397668 RepID=A0AAW7ZD90_9FIRM|nr:transposase [Desulforamulus aquiferis]MDO7787243.1 transposase [Desulforamulus aquiferis]